MVDIDVKKINNYTLNETKWRSWGDSKLSQLLSFTREW